MTPPEELFDVRLAFRLASRAAHDLNNVSAVLSGHVFLLQSDAESREEGLSEIEKALVQLQRLSRSLSELARMGQESVADLDVNTIVRECAGRAGSAASPVETELDPSLPPLTGRIGDVTRAVSALLQNALEAGPSTAPVRLSTRWLAAEECALILVEDRGPGIPPRLRDCAFDPFVSSRGERGRGIGLTLAAAVAAMHGGGCELADLPDGGTQAALRLRALPAAAQREPGDPKQAEKP